MYKSPIEIICEDVKTQIDNDIYRVVQKYDIKVDKNELIQALQYDRDQYEKGYADGLRDAMNEVVRCKDCKHYTERRNNAYKGHFCERIVEFVQPNDFCSYGERREGE